MTFNSYEFVFLFLPITVILYYLGNRINYVIGKMVIVLAGLLFFLYQQPNMICFLVTSILINYLSALLIGRSDNKKLTVAITIAINLGLLLYFKYFNFAVTNFNKVFDTGLRTKEIALPLGISFFTFQQVSYDISLLNGEVVNCSLLDYLTYILYFPKLIMGPITDPSELISQFNQLSNKKPQISNIASGIKMFSMGLFKKVVFADTFASAVSWAYSNTETLSSADCILVMLFYTLEIYFDFSGYSDMAIGVSTVFNIDLPMNFDSPYKAVSIRDFWRRWHISLTSFFTKYLYIPLGGSRKGKVMTYLNTMTVFIVSGLWHGANWTFILWGFLNGALACLERAFEKQRNRIPCILSWGITFALINVLWLLFSAPSVKVWIKLMSSACSLNDISISYGMTESIRLYGWQILSIIPGINDLFSKVHGLYKIMFILFAMFICFIPQNNYRDKDKLDMRSLIIASVCFIWGVLCLGSESTFVYFGF